MTVAYLCSEHDELMKIFCIKPWPCLQVPLSDRHQGISSTEHLFGDSQFHRRASSLLLMFMHFPLTRKGHFITLPLPWLSAVSLPIRFRFKQQQLQMVMKCSPFIPLDILHFNPRSKQTLEKSTPGCFGKVFLLPFGVLSQSCIGHFVETNV